MTTIKEDKDGLYAEIEGWVCRPPVGKRPVTEGLRKTLLEGTKFKKGDKVRGTHPAGGLANLRVGKQGTKDYRLEAWTVIKLTDKAEAAYQEYKGVRT